MKKIMIALATVAFAAVSQAAVVNWQLGYITGPGANGTGWGDAGIGGDGYLATLYVSSAVTGDASSGYALGSLVAFESGDTLTGAEMYDGYAWGVTSDSLTDDTSYYAQVIVTYGDSILKSQIVQVDTSAVTGTTDPVFGLGTEVMNVTALPGQTLDAEYGVFNAAGWQAVPEPTSGLLLLLGMAGLALRRKRA